LVVPISTVLAPSDQDLIDRDWIDRDWIDKASIAARRRCRDPASNDRDWIGRAWIDRVSIGPVLTRGASIAGRKRLDPAPNVPDWIVQGLSGQESSGRGWGVRANPALTNLGQPNLGQPCRAQAGLGQTSQG
jgi:hypothetical protein